MLFTIAHELTHFIRQNSPAKFDALADIVVNKSNLKGKVSERIEQKLREAKDRGEPISRDTAYEEVIADSMETILTSGRVFELMSEIQQQDKTLWEQIRDWFMDFIKSIREAYKGVDADTVEGQAIAEMDDVLKELEQVFAEGLVDAGENFQTAEKNTTEGGVKLMAREDSARIKEQIKSVSPALNKMDLAASVKTDGFKGMRKSNIAKEIEKEYAKIGNKVDRQNFGTILLEYNQINKALEYLYTEGEYAALLTVPRVLKRGIIADSHTEHKDRQIDSFTIAAPVEINGQRGNVGVVVQRVKGTNRFKTLRILLPNGKAFEFVKNTEADSTAGSSSKPKDLEGIPIESASNNSIRNNEGIVNPESAADLDISADEKSKTAILKSARNEEYLAAVNRADMKAAQKMVETFAMALGYRIRAYHGTGRSDRVGTVFLPERATSWPMAFFTDSKEIAEHYARDKADTSLAYDEEYADYYSQFRVNQNGKSIKVQDLWRSLPFAEKQRVKEAGKHITWDEDMENIVWDGDATHGLGNWDAYTLNLHKGNAIEALIDCWLESGELYGNEGNFIQVLELAGIKGVEYRDPDARYEKVYDTFLKILNPFNTASVDGNFADDFEKWYSQQPEGKYNRDSAAADLWDKNSQTAEKFLIRIRDDIENGTSYAWTSIPDSMTDYLKYLGYDGIKDAGGKNGGETHTVWIPFSSEQIKSADPVTYDNDGNIIPLSERFNESKKDIRYSSRGQNWKPKLDRTEWGIVNYAVDNNQGTEITSTCNMFLKKSKGRTVFGIYSTVDSTLLYASTNKKAEKEATFVDRLAKEYENGDATDKGAKNVRAVIEEFRMQQASNNSHVPGLGASGRYAGNGRVHGATYGRNTDPALRNVLENIFEKDIERRAGNERVKKSNRTTESLSTRSILTNALEGVAQNEWEQNKLNEYKENIAKVEEMESRLQEINSQLYPYGKKMPQKERIALQDEAVGLRNKITNIDKKLLRLEATKPLQNVLNRERARVRREMKQKAEERISEVKAEAAQRLKRRSEGHAATEMRKKIRKTIRELDKILNRGDKKRNVKEGMKDRRYDRF